MSDFGNSVEDLQFQYGAAGVLMALGLVAAAALFAYLCGCFNGSVIVSKYILKDDVRNHGSGNAGLTNFYRVFGGPLTVVVLLTDVLKAVAAVLAGGLLIGNILGNGNWTLVTEGRYFAGLFCIVGHMFPCFFGYRGGKGILCGGVIAIICDWRVAVIVWAVFLIFAGITRWVSLGSCCAAAAFAIATGIITLDIPCTLFSVICAVLMIWKHRDNLGRLVHGEEPKFSLHRNKDG